MAKKRVAYPGLTRVEALEKQREANRRLAAKNPDHIKTRKQRDIERLGLEEYNRRRAEISRQYRSKNRAKYLETARKSNTKRLPALRQWKRERRAKNPSHYADYQRKWHTENKTRVNTERRNAYMHPEIRKSLKDHNAKSYQKTRADRIKKVAEWKAANPAKAKEISKRGNMKRRSLRPAGSYSQEAFIARCEYFGWLCRYCRLGLNYLTVTVDHMIPLSRGGSNWASNLVPCCMTCNKRKHKKTFFEYHAIIAWACTLTPFPHGPPVSTRRRSRGPI